MRRSGVPPGRGRKCVGRGPGGQDPRPDHRRLGLAALVWDDKARNSPPKTRAQARHALRLALGLIRRRFGRRAIVPASALIKGGAP
jgi:hypothetical protein